MPTQVPFSRPWPDFLPRFGLHSLVLGVATAVLLLTGSSSVEAQQAGSVYRIGYVSAGLPSHQAQDPFRQGLKEAGYIEGKNVVIEARFAKGNQERLAELVADVLRREPDVLVVVSTRTALAAKEATKTVPIVFASVFDPVAAGIVTSLARPEGNITGTAMGVGEGFGGKWLELLKQAVPGISHVALLWSSSNLSSTKSAQEVQAAARILNVKLDMFDSGSATNLDKALAAIGASSAQGLIVAPDPYFNANRATLIRFAAIKRLPAVYFFESFVRDGGLMAYGANSEESIRRAAAYVDRILKGAKPADLPVEQPTRFELVVNRKTALALGLKLPQALLVRAHQVID